MKKLISIVMATLLVFSNAAAFAAESGSISVKVTIEHTPSIEIIGDALDFVKMGVNEAKVSAAAIGIKNNGSGIDETVVLTAEVSSPPGSGWQPGVPDREKYRLTFQVKDAGGAAPLASDPNWELPGDIETVIAYDETKDLWAKLETPTVTAETAEQVIDVNISIKTQTEE